MGKGNAKIHVCSPMECSKSDRSAFAELVTQSERVDPHGLECRIRRAHRLAFCRIGGEVVSIAAIKMPYADYKNKVFRNASAERDPAAFTLEYGWAFTKESHRRQGYALAIASALLRDIDQPVFATTQSDNAGMQTILENHGFSMVGSPYRGRDSSLVLYVRRRHPQLC